MRDSPKRADKRIDIGHIEADTVVGKNHKGAIVTLVDKATCFAFGALTEVDSFGKLGALPSLDSFPVSGALTEVDSFKTLGALPPFDSFNPLGALFQHDSF